MTNYSFHPAFLLLVYFISCKNPGSLNVQKLQTRNIARPPGIIRDIPLPEGFSFYAGKDSLFANWLLNQTLRKDNKVYLHNGSLKQNQHAQYAVMDIYIGKKNLVQCADAVIKLRAEYFFQTSQFEKIVFLSTSGEELSFSKWQTGTRCKEKNGKEQKER